METFEMRHTLRLYDQKLVLQLSDAYEQSSDRFHNKNEFMTEIVKLGLYAFGKGEPNQQAEAVNFKEVTELLEETLKYLTSQFKRNNVNFEIVERLLSSMYNLLLRANEDDIILTRKTEEGFYDELPARFATILNHLETRYGLR